jgi:hypothetical protein
VPAVGRVTDAPVVVDGPCPELTANTVVCTGSGTTTTSFTEPFGRTVTNPPPAELFHGISFGGTDEHPLVTFKIDNPFDAPADVYVQFNQPLVTSDGVGSENVCEMDPDVPACNPGEVKEITAACLTYEGKTPYTVIDVFFVVAGDSISISGQAVTIPECCYEEEATSAQKKFHYIFVVYCACPEEQSFNLRRE